MTALSLVMPYYRNPGMLALHYEQWASFPTWIKDRLEVVIVDDGSPVEKAIDVPRPDCLPRLSIYRVLEDRPWHQHGARNLGADRAIGEWLLLTDMDHVFPAESYARLIPLLAEDRIHGAAFMFKRYDAPDLKPTLDKNGKPKPHPNTFLMTRNLYWRVGGYDEDYCGLYGTDGLFRSRLQKVSKLIEFPGVHVIRYSREVVPDASTRDMARKEGRPANGKRRIQQLKILAGREHKITTLNFPWERQL